MRLNQTGHFRQKTKQKKKKGRGGGRGKRDISIRYNTTSKLHLQAMHQLQSQDDPQPR